MTSDESGDGPAEAARAETRPEPVDDSVAGDGSADDTAVSRTSGGSGAAGDQADDRLPGARAAGGGIAGGASAGDQVDDEKTATASDPTVPKSGPTGSASDADKPVVDHPPAAGSTTRDLTASDLTVSDRAASAPAAGSAGAAGSTAGGDDGLAGLGGGLDEHALRRMMRGAVGDLEPAPTALDHLRHAVPARRTRRRQALVGAAAAIVLGGAAIPALVHVTAIGDSSQSRPANAASSERTPDPMAGGHHGESGPISEPKKPSKKDKEEEEKAEKEEKKQKDKPAPRPSEAVDPALPNPSSTLAATSPTCGRDQLGDGGSSVGAANAEGQVYGSFRVVNTSGDPCTVDGSGVVGATAQGAANPSEVQVVDHTVGDPATELPPPSASADQLILQPGQAYEVRYAWVPTPGGGATGCAGGSSPSPTPTAEEPQKSPVEGEPATPAPPGDTAGPGSTGGGGGEEPPAPSSVVISHTPDAGDPAVANATVPEACSGTVYHTGALAAP
ncbi:hypothetical protein [Streptomyces sp. NPDC057702]|uniref:hypothetical protein n=1 Tax=unclassified Streptomyces TaxID=2593676 RepID=UPI0036A333F6